MRDGHAAENPVLSVSVRGPSSRGLFSARASGAGTQGLAALTVRDAWRLPGALPAFPGEVVLEGSCLAWVSPTVCALDSWSVLTAWLHSHFSSPPPFHPSSTHVLPEYSRIGFCLGFPWRKHTPPLHGRNQDSRSPLMSHASCLWSSRDVRGA